MSLSQVISRQRNLDRHFTRSWRVARKINVERVLVTKQLESMGKTVVDAVKAFKVPVEPEPEVKLKMERKYVEPVQVKRQEHPAFLYRGSKLVKDMQQALTMTNTVLVSDKLPASITRLQGKYRLPNQAEQLAGVVKDRVMFDACQSRLPRNIDISKLGIWQPRPYGIPRERMCRGLLYGLVNLCERLPIVCRSPTVRNIMHRPFISSFCRGPDEVRLVLRRSPDLVITGARPLPPIMSREEQLELAAENTELHLQPGAMSPLSPYVHLEDSRDYDDSDILPFPSGGDRPFQLDHVHTVLVSEASPLLHRVTPGRISTMGFMAAYMAATAIARRQLLKSGMSPADLEQNHQLDHPVTVQSISTDGRRVQFAVLQLNTLSLAANTHLPTESPFYKQPDPLVPNLAWSESPKPLYTSCGYVEGRPQLTGLKVPLFERLVAVYLNGLQLDDDCINGKPPLEDHQQQPVMAL